MMNRRTSLLRLAAVLSLFVAACGAQSVTSDASAADTAPAHDPGAGPFAGNWSGTARSAVVVVQQGVDAGSMSTIGTSPITVSIASASNDSMSLTISSPGASGSCTFVAERSGSTATLPAGQVCSASDGGVTGAYTLQSGSASVNGNMLQVSLVMSGTFMSGSVTLQVTVQMTITAMPG